MKTINKSLSALSLTAILLLAGCGSYQGDQDIDLTPEPTVQTTSENGEQSDKPDITTPGETAEQTTEPEKETFPDCFIAPYDETWIELYNSYDCEPGYLYFKGSGSEEHRLLLDKKFKNIWLYGLYQTDKEVYAVTDDNELLKVNMRDGSYDTLYTAQYGDISIFSGSDDIENDFPKYFYLVDGEYIIQLETETWEYTTPVHSNNGIEWLIGADYTLAKDKEQFEIEDAYICEECGYDGDFIVWADNDYNYFWYHPETGENEPVLINDGALLYFLQMN